MTALSINEIPRCRDQCAHGAPLKRLLSNTCSRSLTAAASDVEENVKNENSDVLP